MSDCVQTTIFILKAFTEAAAPLPLFYSPEGLSIVIIKSIMLVYWGGVKKNNQSPPGWKKASNNKTPLVQKKAICLPRMMRGQNTRTNQKNQKLEFFWVYCFDHILAIPIHTDFFLGTQIWSTNVLNKTWEAFALYLGFTESPLPPQIIQGFELCMRKNKIAPRLARSDPPSITLPLRTWEIQKGITIYTQTNWFTNVDQIRLR